MAREIKRLADRSDRLLPVDQLRRRDPKAWEKALAWWGDIGINTMLLVVLLEGARVERRQFEEQREARRDSLTTWKIRRARNALKRAEPLICLLKTVGAPARVTPEILERAEKLVAEARSSRITFPRAGAKPSSTSGGPPELFFGDLGEQIERSVQNYVDALRGPALPAHHPGEPWLRKRVLVLARLLPARKESRKRTRRAIEKTFKLAGHGDVATAEKIRHYIREERRRDSTHLPG